MKRWGQGGEEVKATHSEPDEKEEAKTKRGRQAHKHIPLQTEEESGRSSAGLSSFITPNKSVCNPTTDSYSSRREGNNGKFSCCYPVEVVVSGPLGSSFRATLPSPLTRVLFASTWKLE